MKILQNLSRFMLVAEGFNKKGKLADSVVDIERTDNLVRILVTACKETPKLSLSKTVNKHLESSKKQAIQQNQPPL